jgi:tetratricopeptide (TPR) repeat protein
MKGTGGSMDIRVRTFNELGLNAFSNKNYKLALEYFDEALKIDSGNEAILLNKCKVFVKRRSLVEAIGSLDNLLAMNSSNQEAGDMRTECLEMLRKGTTEIKFPKKEDSVAQDNTFTAMEEVHEIGSDEIFEVVEERTEDSGRRKKRSPSKDRAPLKKYVDSCSDEMKSKAIQKSNEIIQKVTEFEKKGIIINDIRPYLEEITSNMDSSNPAGALKVAGKCLAYLSDTKKEYDRTQRLVKRIQQNMLSLRSQGADVKDVDEDLKKVPELLRTGSYKEVLDIAAVSLDKLSLRKVVYQDALDSIRDSWQSIKAALKEGIRDREADEQLSKGRKCVTNGEYDEAIERAKSSQDIIQTSLNALKKLKDEFSSLKTRIVLCQRLEMDVASFQKTLSEIEKFINNGAVDKADDLIFQLKNELSAQEIEYNRGLLFYQITKFKVDEAKTHGVDTSGMEQSLNTMKMELGRGNYENVPVIAEEIQDFVEKSRSVQDQNKALLAIEEAEGLFEDCRYQGIDVSEGISLLKKAKLYFNDSEFARSSEFGRNAIKNFMTLKLVFLLDDTKKLVEKSYKKSDVDLEVAREDLIGVDELILAKDYEEANELLSKIRQPLFEEKAKDQLIKTQEKINEVLALGGEVEKSQKLFSKSQENFKDKDFELAYELSEQAWESAENAKMYEELIDELKSVREFIDKLNKEGIDVSEAKNVLSLAKPALENRFYQTAMDHSKQSKKLAKQAKEMHVFVLRIKKLESRLDSIEEEIENEELMREDLKRAEKLTQLGKKEEIESILFRLDDDLVELESAGEEKRKMEAKKFKQDGNKLFKEGNAKGAIRLFNRALKLTPNDEKIMHNKGVAYKKLNMYRKALRCTKRVLSINPDYAAAKTLRRLCEAEMRKK